MYRWIGLVMFVVWSAMSSAWAVCTVGTKTATITPSTVYYPFAGGAPSITLTYNVVYNNITSNNTGPPCTSNPTIVVTHTNPGGTFSSPNCSFPLAIPNPSTGLNLSGSCNVTWTAPASPAASYTHDASVAATPAQTALAIAATAVTNVIVRRIPRVTIANVTNGNETGPVSGRVRVTQSNAISDPTVVTLSYAGTATNGSDYNGPLTATIPIGATNVLVSLGTIDDAIVEGNETALTTITGVISGPATLGTPVTATNTTIDNDTATVSIASTTNGSETGPANGAMTLTMTKVSKTATTINYGVTGTATPSSDYTTLPGSISIPALTASVTLPIVVLDDAIDDNAETVRVALTSTSNTRVTVGAPNNAINTITDDDTIGLVVSGSPVSVAESGTTGNVDVVLTSQPTGPVTVSVTGNVPAEATLSSTSLTFTAIDWNVPQQITLTGVDDFVDDSDQTFNLTIDPSGADYGSIASASVSVTVVDDDAVGLAISGTPVAVSESGTNANFSVALTSQPTGPVTVSISGNVPAEASLSTTTLNFSALDWNVPQVITVTGVDDFLDDGDQAFNLTIDPSGADYGTIASGTAPVTVTDDDTASVIVTGSPVIVNETGSTGTVEIVLSSAPTADVVMSLAANDTTEASIAPATVTFTSANWNLPQAVTVTGVDDQIVDGEIQSAITIAVASADASYDGFSVLPQQVRTTDNDTAGFTVNGGSLTVAEGGRAKRFSVVLQSAPSSNVILSVAVTDSTEAAVRPGMLTFTSANWNNPQFVTVLGVDDSEVDGSISSTIVVSVVAASSDDDYDILPSQSIQVTTLDNDVVQNDDIVRRAFEAQTHNYLASRMHMLSANQPQIFRMIRRDQGGFLFEGDGQSVKGDFALSSAALAKISPTADFSPPAPKQDLNAWIEGRFAVYDTGSVNAKGNFFVGYAGLDMRLADQLAVGLMTQLDWSEERISTGKIDGFGWMIGPYVTAQPSSSLFFDARALWGQSSNDIQQIVAGEAFEGNFKSDRILLETRLSGEFGTDVIRLRPGATLFWMKEFQDDYTVASGAHRIDINGASASLGQLSAGLNLSRFIAHDQMSIEPFIEPRLIWTFDDPGRMALDGTRSSQNDASASVTVGINVIGKQTQFSLDAAFESALSGGGTAWSGGIQFLHHF